MEGEDDENNVTLMRPREVGPLEVEEEKKEQPQELEEKSANFPNNSKIDSSFGPDLNKEGSKEVYSTDQASESLKIDKAGSSNMVYPEFSKGKSDSIGDYGLSKNIPVSYKGSEVIGIKQEEKPIENQKNYEENHENQKNTEENHENLIIFEEKSEKKIRVRK